MTCIVANQRSPEWHEAHIGKITASLAAACLGLCPHTSRQKAWRIIMGREVVVENSYMTYGKAMEAHALSEYEIETGRLATPTGFWVSDTHPWLGASPDSLVGAEGLVETKCPQKMPTKIPTPYRIQMLVQMIVTGRSWCDFFAWVRGVDDEPDGFFLARCPLQGSAGLVARLKAFHEEFVLGDKEPSRRKPRRRKKAA